MALPNRNMRPRRWSSASNATASARRLLIAAPLVVLATSLLDARVKQDDQQPIFRAGVDLVAVDAQVVDREGWPILGLGPDQFEVEIDGRRRHVEFVEYFQFDPRISGTPSGTPPGNGPAATSQPPAVGAQVSSSEAGRIVMIAFDASSFGVGESRGVVAAAQTFLRRLPSLDRVGLFVFPIGPYHPPTVDRAAVLQSLDTVVGARQSLQSSFNLSASDVIDIIAETAASRTQSLGVARGGAAIMAGNMSTLRRLQIRECGYADVRCIEAIQLEAQSMALIMEGQLNETASGLNRLLRELALHPGRKTLVLLSGGVPASDRPGGRPDAGELARTLGQSAAWANTNVYALYIDGSAATQMSAESARSRQPLNRGREQAVNSLLLDQFAGASGGKLMPVFVGSGEGMLDRVAREISSQYQLGVVLEDRDRDGRLHRLSVKVDQDGASVRSRLWVHLPES